VTVQRADESTPAQELATGPSDQERAAARSQAMANARLARNEYNRLVRSGQMTSNKAVACVGPGQFSYSGWGTSAALGGGWQLALTRAGLWERRAGMEYFQEFSAWVERCIASSSKAPWIQVLQRNREDPAALRQAFDFYSTQRNTNLGLRDEDRGVPGQYGASHAEQQAFQRWGSATIGVTWEPCPDECRPYFQAAAQRVKKFIVVASPSVAWEFYADGRPPTSQ
jgi:hypothetical protein